MFRGKGFCFAPDDGMSGGTTENATGGQSTGPNSGAPAQTTTTQTGAAPISFASEADFQKKVDEIVKERLDRAQKKASEAADAARKQAEADAAAKNGEWQKLAEQRAAEIADAQKKLADLEPVSEQAKKYEIVLKKQLEASKKGLSEGILKLLDRLDPVEQMEWLAANANVAKPPDNVPATPTPNNGGGMDQKLEELRKGFSREVRNMF